MKIHAIAYPNAARSNPCCSSARWPWLCVPWEWRARNQACSSRQTRAARSYCCGLAARYRPTRPTCVQTDRDDPFSTNSEEGNGTPRRYAWPVHNAVLIFYYFLAEIKIIKGNYGVFSVRSVFFSCQQQKYIILMLKIIKIALKYRK